MRYSDTFSAYDLEPKTFPRLNKEDLASNIVLCAADQ